LLKVGYQSGQSGQDSQDSHSGQDGQDGQDGQPNTKAAVSKDSHIVLDKVIADAEAAVADIEDGASLMVGGFGLSGHPIQLLDAVLRKGAKDLTVISNNAGVEDIGLGGLIHHGRVSRVICSFPTGKGMWAIKEQVKAGQVKVEVVPQGTLIERIRAGGAGLGGILTLTGLDTELTEGRQIVEVDNARYVLEPALKADFALVHAHVGDRWGNLSYRLAARNFNPLVAMAGRVTLAQVQTLVALGEMDPSHTHTPGIFVQRVVPVNGQSAVGGKD
jgi:3-oxoadipate CoA-transferase, alpha subunit